MHNVVETEVMRMRSNQVSIKLERFFDAENLGVEDLKIDVYADANNVYEALSAAFFEMLKQLQEEGNIELPIFGSREHYPANSFRYRQIFKEFLRDNNYEDEWRDFQKEQLTLKDQFLKKNNLEEHFEKYKNKKIEERFQN